DCDLIEFDTGIRESGVGSRKADGDGLPNSEFRIPNSQLERAVALYRGPLLEGCLEEWAIQEGQAREQAFLQALETLAHAAMQPGDHAEAARLLRRAVQTDPLRESAQRELMQALAGQGDYAAVTQLYREFRLRLHHELNTEPS